MKEIKENCAATCHLILRYVDLLNGCCQIPISAASVVTLRNIVAHFQYAYFCAQMSGTTCGDGTFLVQPK